MYRSIFRQAKHSFDSSTNRQSFNLPTRYVNKLKYTSTSLKLIMTDSLSRLSKKFLDWRQIDDAEIFCLPPRPWIKN
ncbi:MAG: hypothetical protein IJL14_03620 [Selenomonadaceae bacterium]|nr:hypothetical protein [Selenomonadaceae bacterium]